MHSLQKPELKLSFLFYHCIKFLARCCMLFFFREKMVCGNSLRSLRGPAIIAANHPNSMMDAIAIGCACRQPVHFTIRSDMFNNRLFNFLLKRLNGIPIYRVSEEKGRMRDNAKTIIFPHTIAYCKNIQSYLVFNVPFELTLSLIAVKTVHYKYYNYMKY